MCIATQATCILLKTLQTSNFLRKDANMRKRTFQLAIALLVLVPIGGCLEVTDPNTGQTTKVLDPNSPVVTGGEAVAQGVAAVGPFFGAIGGLAAGIATGILAAWRKVKPSLVAARTKADQYYAAASATVTALEEFKKASPDAWSKMGQLLTDQMTKQGIDPKVIENVIRGLRGLPAKA